ncbi:DUF6882 domain-containing protein [Steroidobacter sp.]|uniref:DUF6882 domain-containing protein n=1 Tax=Steroidobacter sp. TaxID=1978227 RepID=UPI0039C8D4BB
MKRRLGTTPDALKSLFGFGTCERWTFDQATAQLQFYDQNDELRVVAEATDIGSYSEKSDTSGTQRHAR